MKVALLSHEGGGISSVTQGLARSLSKRKVPTTVFTGTSRGKESIEYVDSYLEIVRLPSLNIPPRAIWFQLRNLRTLLMLSDDYDVIHAVSPYVSAASTLSSHCRAGFITSVHGTPWGAMKAFAESPLSQWTWGDFGSNVLELPLNDFIIKRCIAHSDHVVVCSYAALHELKNNVNFCLDKVSVIYNGVDFQEIEHVEVENDENDSAFDFSIVFAGRLYWMKGVMFALKAFELLSKKFRNVELRIFGKGPLEGEIESFVAKRGLEDRVRLGGHMSRRNLLVEIKKSDLVVLPSLYESQPMIALEAMVCKKPVVAFDLPYARELVGGEYSEVLAKPANLEDLCAKISLLLSDRELRFKLGQNGYKQVQRKHNWDILVDKYIAAYAHAND